MKTKSIVEHNLPINFQESFNPNIESLSYIEIMEKDRLYKINRINEIELLSKASRHSITRVTDCVQHTILSIFLHSIPSLVLASWTTAQQVEQLDAIQEVMAPGLFHQLIFLRT